MTQFFTHGFYWFLLRMYKIARNVQQVLKNNMSTWRNVLTLRGCAIGNVRQGDALSPLLFVMCLFPLTDLLRNLNQQFLIDDIVVSHLLYLDDLKLYA